MAGSSALNAAGEAARWFTRLGSPLEPGERVAAAGYAESLGLGSLALSVAADARQAEAIVCDPQWDSRWWAREEGERATLMAEAGSRIGREALLEVLTLAVESHTETSLSRALAAQLLVPGGAELARVASGALLMALHCKALATVAQRGDGHLFMRKYALFALGRWPLGVRRGALHVF
ncbi:MAG TPA: hypothetical protein VMP00_14540 [Burkholderiales bacterium]|nr:hypothetical protein [Burkholderiales bacterium]